ncbi:MAG: hypothetical protein E7656_07205 [Ruminococcaceae bacterium]|nr:hypothetical protein [Oscillospiraceae bacterium]
MEFFKKQICLDEGFDGDKNGNFADGENGNIKMKTIKITPFDLFLLLLSAILFCTVAIDKSYLAVIALVLSAPIYAVFSYRIGNHFSFFIPLVAYIIGFAVTKDSVGPAAVIFAAGTSFSIMRGINYCPDRAKSSAVAGSAVSAVICAFVSLLALKLQYGISPKDLLSQLQGYIDTVKPQLIETISSLEPATLGYAAFEPGDIPKLVDAMAEQTLYMLPAMLVLLAMTVGYISASLTRPAANLCGAPKMLDGVYFEVRLLPISVFVYFICSLLAIFSDGAFGHALNNISYLLSPGLMLCGLKQVGVIFRRKNYSKAALPFIMAAALVIAALLPAGLGTTVLIILGVFYCSHNREPYLQ